MAADYNMILSFPNRVDEAVLSGGDWTAGLPLANLQTRLLDTVARSASLDEADTQFTLTFERPTAVRVLALINHNLSLTARWRIRAYSDDSPATLIYDSGWLYAWFLTSIYWDINSLEWELDEYWFGSYAPEEIEGFTFSAFHVVPGDAKISTLWTIEISDPDNTAGYVQAGRLFLGPGTPFEINYSYGAELGYADDTQIEKSLGNVEFFERREPVRSFAFNYDALTTAEGYARALEIVRRAGISGEVVAIPDPTDEANALRRWIYGRLNRLSPLRQPYWQTMSMGFEVKELK